MRADDVAADRETESRAGPTGGARLVEALEQTRPFVFGHARAGVAHEDPARGAVAGRTQEHGAAVPVVRDRVREQVVDDLTQPQRIRPHERLLESGRVDRDRPPGRRAAPEPRRTRGRSLAASIVSGVSDASTDEDELEAARMSPMMPSRRSALRSATSRFAAQMIGQVGVLDREVEVSEDRGERGAQFVRDRGDQLVAGAQGVQLGRHVSRDDDGPHILPRGVGETPRGDAERLAWARFDAEPDDLAVERLAAEGPLDGQLVGRQRGRPVVAERGDVLSLRALVVGAVDVGADRLLEPAVRVVRDGHLTVGRDADHAEVDGIEHLRHLLLLPAGALEHASQQLRLLGQQSALRIRTARGQMARRRRRRPGPAA